MDQLRIHTNPAVEEVFENYPPAMRPKLDALRELILETAAEVEAIEEIEETLKWGEPSFLVKKGSTIRIDWKKGKPDQYAMYFKCTSKLVETFREVYGDLFTYEKNRALVFSPDQAIPVKELKSCIASALQYHVVKKMPLLGIEVA